MFDFHDQDRSSEETTARMLGLAKPRARAVVLLNGAESTAQRLAGGHITPLEVGHDFLCKDLQQLGGLSGIHAGK
jgi:hypothetical protein